MRGALDAIHAVPGLALLIALAAFNNLLFGVFMALMDAYGLELVPVETWGFLWGFISLAMILGGIWSPPRSRPPSATADHRRQPRELDAVRHVHAALVDRPARDRDVRLAGAGPGDRGRRADRAPAVDPFERQGRVFGFAQLVENAAAPVTAF